MQDLDLPRRQLFLYRNIRKFKLRNSLRKSPSSEVLSSPETFASKNLNDNPMATNVVSTSTVDTSMMDSNSTNIDRIPKSSESQIVKIKSRSKENLVTTDAVSSSTIDRYPFFDNSLYCIVFFCN